MIRVASMRRGNWPRAPWQIRCDRSNVLGNPFGLHRLCDRDLSCDQYDARFQVAVDPQWHTREETYDLTTELVEAINLELEKLVKLYHIYGELELMCWCAPLRCHTETIQKYLQGRI